MTDKNLKTKNEERFSLWQLLEFKSAKTEGLIASIVLSIAQSENLKIPARMFFATKSPLEFFLPQSSDFDRPIGSDLEYLAERARLLSLCRRLQTEHEENQNAFSDFENIKWLIKFQLYGFFEHCFQKGRYLFGLLALKEAELLDKWQVRTRLSNLSKKDEKTAKIIAEFIDL